MSSKPSGEAAQRFQLNIVGFKVEDERRGESARSGRAL